MLFALLVVFGLASFDYVGFLALCIDDTSELLDRDCSTGDLTYVFSYSFIYPAALGDTRVIEITSLSFYSVKGRFIIGELFNTCWVVVDLLGGHSDYPCVKFQKGGLLYPLRSSKLPPRRSMFQYFSLHI